jgi:hypothetical protein
LAGALTVGGTFEIGVAFTRQGLEHQAEAIDVARDSLGFAGAEHRRSAAQSG